MSEEPIDKIVRAVEPYMPIGGQLRPMLAPETVDYMVSLVKDDNMYKTFEADPITSFQQNNIDVQQFDSELFIETVKSLRARAKGLDSSIGKIATTISQKETSEGAQYNFDHSSSWFYGIQRDV